MKTSIVVLAGGIETSKTFENKIVNLVNKALEKESEEIILWDVSIGLGSAYGHFKKIVRIEVDECVITLTKTITHAPDYDYYSKAEMNQAYSNFLKRIALDLIEEYDYEIQEAMEEEE